jgi:hypothetical protein
MKYIIALLLALVVAPVANARAQCKPAGMEYLHGFEQRPNWGVYWWCDYKTYDYTVFIAGDTTQQSIEQFWGWVMGINPSWADVPARDKDDPLMKSLSDAAFAFASADANRPPAPPPEVWIVAKNGKYPDRPTYPMSTTGVRGTKSDGRATVGSPCDCRAPHVEGKTTYCPLAGGVAIVITRPMSVAVCTQAGP